MTIELINVAKRSYNITSANCTCKDLKIHLAFRWMEKFLQHITPEQSLHGFNTAKKINGVVWGLEKKGDRFSWRYWALTDFFQKDTISFSLTMVISSRNLYTLHKPKKPLLISEYIRQWPRDLKKIIFSYLCICFLLGHMDQRDI